MFGPLMSSLNADGRLALISQGGAKYVDRGGTLWFYVMRADVLATFCAACEACGSREGLEFGRFVSAFEGVVRCPNCVVCEY